LHTLADTNLTNPVVQAVGGRGGWGGWELSTAAALGVTADQQSTLAGRG